jgi:hypothetical protein
MNRALKVAEAAILLVASTTYLCHVFQLLSPEFWSSGLGDWGDPYFINYLLEHWYTSIRTLADPSSPPMFFPARKTLGYSHGLILYVPFYLPVRLILHAFQAYSLTLVLVLETGIVCLYVIVRRYLGLSLVESLLLTASFVGSQNVINETTGVWSQRASVFLIPPILLMLLASRRLSGPGRLALAALSGLLTTLLYAHDFYTAHFAWAFAILFLAAALPAGTPKVVRERVAAFWRNERPRSKVVLAVTALALAWTCYVRIYGGAELQWLGMRLRSHDWRRPALAAVACLAMFVALRGGVHVAPRFRPWTMWLVALVTGAVLGSVVFLWIYWSSYTEHPAFAEHHILNALATRHPSQWTSPLAAIRDLSVYDSMRPFALVLVLGALSWIPWFNGDKTIRRYSLWLFVVSLIVLLAPLRLGGFSIWRLLIEPLPGFPAIRDPRRIIYLYELAVVLAGGVILARLPTRSAYRRCAVGLLFVLLVAEPTRVTFAFGRPNAAFARWVEPPIDIDPSCRSFFIRAASEAYQLRSGYSGALYSVDAMFISLARSMPTLNGFSAWAPAGWAMHDPHAEGYQAAVKSWIEQHGLRGVCALDIDARTMRPYTPGPELTVSP